MSPVVVAAVVFLPVVVVWLAATRTPELGDLADGGVDAPVVVACAVVAAATGVAWLLTGLNGSESAFSWGFELVVLAVLVVVDCACAIAVRGLEMMRIGSVRFVGFVAAVGVAIICLEGLTHP